MANRAGSKGPAGRTKGSAKTPMSVAGKAKPRAAKPGPPAKKPARTSGRTKAAVAKTSPPADSAPLRGAPSAAPPATAPSARASPGRPRVKIRMYRQGLGDCFLIAIRRNTSPDPYLILIDCGVVLGTPDAGATMTKVVEDIVHESGGKIDLLLATHEHWDHVSGFIQ